MTEQINNNECICVKKNCVRYGNCKDCIEHHSKSKRYPRPYCQGKRRKKPNNLINKTG